MTAASGPLASPGFEGYLRRALRDDDTAIAAAHQVLACLAPMAPSDAPAPDAAPSTWVLACFLETEAALGGLKMLYRLVDVLNANEFPAAVVHSRDGFRCSWFENRTVVHYLGAPFVRRGDLLVIPEVFGPYCAEVGGGVRKVIYNQNAYYTFQGYTFDSEDNATPYLHPDVAAALVVSEDNRRYLAHAFPGLALHRIRHSVRPDLFHPGGLKQRQICFMPRKGEAALLQVLSILRFRGALAGVTLAPIDGVSEREVAERMRESLLFLAAGPPEGYGLPLAEAMACGCVVAAFPGGGGRELLRPEDSLPVEQDDVVALASACEAVLARHRQDPAAVEAMGQRAAARIAADCSPEGEERSILAAWRALLAPAPAAASLRTTAEAGR